MAALDIVSLDTATPQLEVPGAADTYNAPRAITVNPVALTGSAATPSLDIAQTWNTTGTPTALKVNVVADTGPSNAASNLLDLQVGGATKFKVRKSGATELYGTFVQFAGGNDCGLSYNTPGEVAARVRFAMPLVSPDTFIFRDDAGIFAQRNGTNPQAFRVYNTYTTGSDYERGKIAWESNVLRIGTEKAGVGFTARALEFQTDGVTRLTIETTGTTISAGGGFRSIAPSVGTNCFQARWGATFPVFQVYVDGTGPTVDIASTGSLRWSDNSLAVSSFDIGLARSAAGKIVITNGSTGAGSLVFRDAGNIEAGTTTGTKIGTATTQKLGFYNATPVVQPTAVADATDAATVITQLNALLSRMRDLGLIAT